MQPDMCSPIGSKIKTSRYFRDVLGHLLEQEKEEEGEFRSLHPFFGSQGAITKNDVGTGLHLTIDCALLLSCLYERGAKPFQLTACYHQSDQPKGKMQ